MANQALRVLGVAYRKLDRLPEKITADEIERDLIFVGLIGMIDPARPEVKPAIDRGAARGHSHRHDHGRSSRHGAGHRQPDRIAARGRPRFAPASNSIR